MEGQTMLFHEIYGTYYQVVSAILSEAVDRTLTRKRLNDLVQELAFGESNLTIPAKLQQEKWQLLRKDYTTPIQRTPSMPLTLLEKRWLKALLQDPRIALFDVDDAGLEDVEPLYNPTDIAVADQAADGDPWTDPAYIAHFRTALQAVREQRPLHVKYRAANGHWQRWTAVPSNLEYSPKDDKFRLLIPGRTLNMARILECALADPEAPLSPPTKRPEDRSVTFLLKDQRNALERVLLHFSHLEKETVQLEEDLYRCTLRYRAEDETEMVIRILSFGPMLQVTDPPAFLDKIRDRLQRQRALGVPETHETS